MASGADIGSRDERQLVVDLALDTWGRIDGLIHNAAIVLDDHFEDVSDDDYDSIMAVNMRDTFRTVRAAYRAMKDNGGGHIVTLTSASGLSGAFGQAAYAATKMGVLGIMRAVAWEGMRFGVRVNALAPAAFDTRLFSVFTPDGDAALRGRPPELEISLDSAEYMALLTASRVTSMPWRWCTAAVPRRLRSSGPPVATTADTQFRTLKTRPSGLIRASRMSPETGTESAADRCPMNLTARRWSGEFRRIRND